MRTVFTKASPNTLFVLGLVTLPAFLFQEKLLFRLLDGLMFLVLALWSGKRIRPVPALLLLASVTLAALFVPHGKIIASPFGIPVTEGALKMGFSRGILLLGLFYLSKFTVVKGLELPGKTGNGLAKVFFYFERFSENYSQISIRNLPDSLDKLLLKISETSAGDNTSELDKDGKGVPLLIPVLVSLSCWVLLIL